MATQPVWTRAYLKSLGAKDDEIDYQNGAVTYKNKPFQYTTPESDGKAYGTQQQLDSAYKTYQANDALDQYKQNISKAPQPFSYDMNSIKSDPLYTAGLQSLQKDAQTATNQSLVNLGRRGIGNSQSAVTSANAQQQKVNELANTKLAPQIIAQKYQQYLDANAQQDKQNQALLGYANAMNGLNQQDIVNRRADEQTALQRQQANLEAATTVGQQFGRALQPKDDWSNLYNQDDAPLSLQGKNQELNNTQTIAQLTGKLPDGTPTNAAQQQQLQNLWMVAEQTGTIPDNLAEIYGLPRGTQTQAAKAQAFSQSAENRRIGLSAQGQAQSQGNAMFGRLMDIWQATGKAPEGIPGVAAGTPLAGKQVKSSASDYKMNPDFASEIATIKANPAAAVAQIEANAEALINAYSYEGYKELLKAAGANK